MPFFKSAVEIVVITWNILPLEAKFVKIEMYVVQDILYSF